MKAKTKFSQAGATGGDGTLNITEIAADLVTEANFYTLATEDLPDLTTAEFGSQLSKMLDAETIRFFLEGGDYGRGFLSGLAIGVATLEMEVDRQLNARADEVGGEDLMTDDDYEEVIFLGLKNGTKGGGIPDGEVN